jgi:hypothetical protein
MEQDGSNHNRSVRKTCARRSREPTVTPQPETVRDLAESLSGIY